MFSRVKYSMMLLVKSSSVIFRDALLFPLAPISSSRMRESLSCLPLTSNDQESFRCLVDFILLSDLVSYNVKPSG